jgi:short-subunit dehydrogenase
MDLRGAVVTVTGASAGIGWSTAWAFASRGSIVVVSARRADRLERLAGAIAERGGTAAAIACDVRDRASVEALRDEVSGRFGRCDVLVNDAGVPGGGRFLDLSIDAIEQVVQTNLMGVIHGTKAFLPGMVERGRGHVVNVASLAGRFAVPGSAVYSATKHAVVAFSEALHYEIGGSGCLVTAVNPGLVATERFRHDDVRGRGGGRLVMEPERVAAVIVDVVRAGRAPEVFVPRLAGAGQALRILAPPLYRYAMRKAAASGIRPSKAD